MINKIEFTMDKDITGNSFATTVPILESVQDYKHKVKKCDENDGGVKEGFYCDICEYKTGRKNNMDKHLKSKKHKEEIERMALKNGEKGVEVFKCKCGNSYTHVSSLSRHKRTCSVSIEDENNKKMCHVVLGVVQKQSELIGNLQHQVLELTKASITAAAHNSNSNSNNGNNTNSNNKIKNKTMGNTNNNHLNNCGNFNINIFLNEQCKDAINLSDFVKSLEITFENLKIVNQTGVEESVSTLILKGLENMDVCKRPIHCTDQKRDVMYVKEEEKWEKDEGNDKLKNSIDDISRRHVYTLKKFKDVNPEIKVGHAMHDDFIQTMNRICTPIEDPGKKRIVKQVGKNVAMNAEIANDSNATVDDDDEREDTHSSSPSLHYV
jgi:hypothetical protein